MNTKESILLEALKLFSRNGYEGVSVRDIAKQLGITQAALYKHYKNKHDIFDSIVNHMNEDYEKRVNMYGMPQGSSSSMAEEYKNFSLDIIKKISMAQFKYWTQDEYGSCFRKMLTLEQFRNPHMADLYQQNFGSGVISYMSSLFNEMMKIGAFRKGDARLAALDFYSPIFMMSILYDEADNKDELIELLEAHVEQFTLKYKF